MTGRQSWAAPVFDRLYAEKADPWGFETSVYERDKYAATLDALDGRHFISGFEAGCSIGVFTHALASRCDRLLATDISEVALQRARVRCCDQPTIDFLHAALPASWPAARHYDLITFSEILYFMDEADIRQTAMLAREHLMPGGLVLTVNWTGATNTPVTGDAASTIFHAGSQLHLDQTWRHASYRLDRFLGPPAE